MNPIDDLLSGDYSVFAECEAEQGTVREGDWSPFATLAWIASLDAGFVGAVQRYEIRSHANRGGLHSSAAWLVLGNIAGERFGLTLTDAAERLREKLEAGGLEGGTAIERGPGGKLILVARHQWRQWCRAFQIDGIELLPGLVDFKWPSDAVTGAFPVEAQPARPAQSPPKAWTEQKMKEAIASCSIGNREKAWAEVFRPTRNEHGWDNAAFRSVWSEGRNSKGTTGRPAKRA